MRDDATREIKARLESLTQAKALHEQLPLLDLELARLRERKTSAVEWEAALPYMLYLCDAVALCQDHLEGMRGN